MKTSIRINQTQPRQNNLTELIEQNRQLLQHKKISYQEKIAKYRQKLRALQKCLHQINKQLQDNQDTFQQDDDELEENKLIIQRKIQQLNFKIKEYQERLDKLHQIQSQMHLYIHDDDSEMFTINGVNQSKLLTQNRSKSGSSCKSHHKNINKIKGLNSSGNKIGHRRERTVSNDDLRPNIFNTPISKSFSRNTQITQIDENFINIYPEGYNVGTNKKKKQKMFERVPLGQLLMSQQLQTKNQQSSLGKNFHKHQKDQRQIVKFFKMTETSNISNNYEKLMAQDKLSLSKIKINSMTEDCQQSRGRTKSVPTIYPFGRGDQSSQKKITSNKKSNQLNQKVVDFSVTHEYISYLNKTIGELFQKYPFICESVNQNSRFNSSIVSSKNIPLQQSLHILLRFIESQDQRLEQIRQLKQKNEKIMSRVSCEKRNMKSLQYDKMGLEQEIQEFQLRVKGLIEQERRLLENIDRIEEIKVKLVSDLKTEVSNLRCSLQEKIRYNKPTLSITNISKFQLYPPINWCFTQIQSQKQQTSIFNEIFHQLKLIKQQLHKYLQQNNAIFSEINASKFKLESNLQKLKAQHEMIRIKRDQVDSQLAQTTTTYQQMLKNVSKLQNTIHKLTTQITQHQSQQQSLSATVNQLSSIIQTKKQSIKSLEQIIQKKKLKKKELFEIVDKVQKVLQEADGEHLVLGDKIHQLKEDADRLIKENEELARMNDGVKAKMAEGRAEVKRLQQEHREMLSKLTKITDQVGQKESHLSQVQSNIKDKAKQIALHEIKQNQLNQQQSDLNNSIHAKQTQIITIDQQIRSKNSQLSLTQTKLSSSVQRLNQLTSLIIKKEQQMTCLTNRISIAEIQFRNVQRQEQVVLENINSHQVTISQLQNKHSQMETKIQQTISTKQQLQEIVIQILQQKETYLQQLQAKNNQLLNLQQSIHTQNIQLHSIQSKINHSQLCQASLQDIIQQLSTTIQTLEQQMHEHQEDQAEIVQRIKLLKRLQLKKCLRHGLLMGDQAQLTPQEEKLILARIDEVVGLLEDYQMKINHEGS